MNKSTLFRLAHKLTKVTIKTGDNYQVTFGACLKIVNQLNFTGSDKQLAWADKIHIYLMRAMRCLSAEAASEALAVSIVMPRLAYLISDQARRTRGRVGDY